MTPRAKELIRRLRKTDKYLAWEDTKAILLPVIEQTIREWDEEQTTVIPKDILDGAEAAARLAGDIVAGTTASPDLREALDTLKHTMADALHNDWIDPVGRPGFEEDIQLAETALSRSPLASEASELREALKFVRNDLLDIEERVASGILRLYARRSVERIDALLTKGRT